MKRFFNEKEVTSTLVMDALFCGCKQAAEASSTFLQVHDNQDLPIEPSVALWAALDVEPQNV